MTRIEALIAKALSSASAGLRTFLALTNRGTNGMIVNLDDQATPAGVVIAAASVTKKASGLFMVGVSWFGVGDAAAAIGIALVQQPGTTALSGGTASTDGTWRIALGGALTATAAGPAFNAGAQFNLLPAPGAAFITWAGLADFSGTAIGSHNLISVTLVAPGENLTAQSFGHLYFYELP